MGVVGRAHNRTLWTFTFRACAPRPGETTAERDRETTGSNGIGKIKEPNQTTAAAHQGPLHSPIVTQRMWTLDFVGAAAISSVDRASKDRDVQAEHLASGLVI